jgi:hypothetical protein
MPAWKKVITSGSDAALNSLTVTNGITGSLFGTSSYATTSSFLSTTTNAFIQNGNSFGTTATLGTNDNQPLAFETNGTTKMFISSSGNVGIGTTAPSRPLHIKNTATNDANKAYILIDADGTIDGAATLRFSQNVLNWSSTLSTHTSAGGVNFGLQLNDGGTPTFVTNKGTVFIGNTFTIPSASLHVKGAYTAATSASLLVQNSTTHSFAIFGDNKVKVYSPTANYTTDISNDDSYGNLGTSGIGSHIRMSNTSNDTLFTQAGFFSSGVEIKGSPWYGYVLNLDKGIYLADDYLRFGTGRINSSGSLGIGTISPSASLDVSGSARITNGLTVTGSLIAPSITGSLCGTSSWAVSASWAPGGGGSSITVKDEGSTLTSALTSLDFVGSGVTATNTGGAVTVTVAGAGGSAFPYTGSARITGSLGVTGSLSVAGSDALINGVTIGRGGGSIATNTAIGSQSLASNTTGTDNTAVGIYTLKSNTSGGTNTAVGISALYTNSTGGNNTALGYGSLNSTTTANSNTAIGSGAGLLLTGEYNLLLGTNAGQNIEGGNYNNIIGGGLTQDPADSGFDGSYTLSIGKHSVDLAGKPHIWSPDFVAVADTYTDRVLRLEPTIYSAFFIEYVIDDNAGNMRGGTLKGVFLSDMSKIEWSEENVLSIGDTSTMVFTVVDNGAGALEVCLENNSGLTIYCNLTSRLMLRIQ